LQQRRSIFTRLEANDRELGRLGRERLRLIRELEASGEWDYGEFRDLTHWVACHLQISWIDAKRRVEAAEAIEALPVISSSLECGELSLDKAVQLTRHATPETEEKLVAWARTVSVKTVRENADAACARDLEEVKDNDRARNFGWRKIEGGSVMSFFGALPIEQGAVVASALDRLAESLKDAPHEEIPDLLPADRAETLAARRADALVLSASHELATDFDADRATVIVHASAEALASTGLGAELEDGSLIHPETARRLTCDCRIQAVLQDGAGEPIGIGRVSQTVPPWLRRLVKQRDRSCTFPGCGDTRYTEAHHIWHWGKGGPTDLDNLILVCGFHHKAVHEYGWSVQRRPDNTVEWFRPSGRLHGVRSPLPTSRRAPPREGCAEQPELLPV
jgi:hypothetical protein